MRKSMLPFKKSSCRLSSPRHLNLVNVLSPWLAKEAADDPTASEPPKSEVMPSTTFAVGLGTNRRAQTPFSTMHIQNPILRGKSPLFVWL